MKMKVYMTTSKTTKSTKTVKRAAVSKNNKQFVSKDDENVYDDGNDDYNVVENGYPDYKSNHRTQNRYKANGTDKDDADNDSGVHDNCNAD